MYDTLFGEEQKERRMVVKIQLKYGGLLITTYLNFYCLIYRFISIDSIDINKV